MSTKRLIYLIKHFLLKTLTRKSPTQFKWISPYQQNWWARNWRNVLYFSLAFLMGSLIIFALVYGYNAYMTVLQLKEAEELERWGRLGDHVGGLSNILFYYFGLMLLFFTILLQIQEMKRTRDKLKKVAQFRDQQNKLQKPQNFENTYFRLLQLHHRYANRLICDEIGRSLLGGRQCFGYFYQRLKTKYHEKQKEFLFSSSLSSINLEKEIIRTAYRDFYKSNQDKLGHYFHNLYHIIEFVENNYLEEFEQLNEKNQREYMIILSSQFSSHELILLFYHSLYLWYEFGQPEFFNALEDHLLLEDLQRTLLFKKIHYEFYPKNAHYNPWLYE
jgi:hypothetical protein